MRTKKTPYLDTFRAVQGQDNKHCVKSDHIRSFPVRIQSESEKIRTKKTPSRNTFHAVKAKENNVQELSHFITSFNLYMKQVVFNLMMKKQEI